MAINPYSLCPCGSGKKLKFCCGDLAAEIEKIYQMIQGDQPRGALKHVEQLLEKTPDQGSLLDLRSSLELSLHEFEAARDTVATFVKAHPDSASAHAQRAILVAATESGTAAIAPLQDALELLEKDMPLRVLEAIGAVGQALLVEGQLVAARGHLLLYAGIAPEEDNRGLELLMRMNLQAGLPLLLRDYLVLSECPHDAEWREPYLEALRNSARGLWRKSADILIAAIKKHGMAPEMVYSLALLQGWLGNTDAFVAGLHKYAMFEVPTDDAVEAEALAQLLDTNVDELKIETARTVFAIEDEAALEEKLRADSRIEDYQLEPPASGEEDAPRPRSSYILLDREPPESGASIERGDVPQVMGFLSLFGKRTDRPAQLEITADRSGEKSGEQQDESEKLLREILGDDLGEVIESDVVNEKSLSEESLSWRWRLPDDTPMELRRQLLAEQRAEAVLEHWTAAPRGALLGKSPLEASDDEKLRVPLLASVLIIEQAAEDPKELKLFEKLRDKLKLPAAEEIDPTNIEVQNVPLVRIPRLRLGDVAAENLSPLLERTVLMGANLATLLVATEIVEREDLPEDFDLAGAYRRLIRLEPDVGRRLHWVQQARSWSKSQDQSEAEWSLLELEMSIEQGDPTRVQSLLGELRERHMEEPGVAEAIYKMLYQAGLIDPSQMAGQPMPAMPGMAEPVGAAKATSEPSGIWTPGSDAPQSSDSAGGDKPAIWTP